MFKKIRFILCDILQCLEKINESISINYHYIVQVKRNNTLVTSSTMFYLKDVDEFINEQLLFGGVSDIHIIKVFIDGRQVDR